MRVPPNLQSQRKNTNTTYFTVTTQVQERGKAMVLSVRVSISKKGGKYRASHKKQGLVI